MTWMSMSLSSGVKSRLNHFGPKCETAIQDPLSCTVRLTRPLALRRMRSLPATRGAGS